MLEARGCNNDSNVTWTVYATGTVMMGSSLGWHAHIQLGISMVNQWKGSDFLGSDAVLLG
jgi:hypothetical protein